MFKSVDSDLKKVLEIFIKWRLFLFAVVFFSVNFISNQSSFLGGGLDRYISNPQFWSWLNFDGEHYLSIAQQGYKPLTYFYFPLYPLVVRLLSVFDKSIFGYAIAGLVVSHVFLLLALSGLVKLVKLDFKKINFVHIISLLLFFPTSFYFAGFYTESLFLALVVWAFYFARSKKWIWAGILGCMLTTTRLVGLSILPALFIEAYLQKRERGFNLKKVSGGLLLIPFGILGYMYFLKSQTGDPLEFLHSVEIFGQQRSSTFIVLPQVFYRYVFKVLPNINYDYLPVVFTTYLEFIVALVFTAAVAFSLFRQRISYAVYSLFAFVIPTLSGSFSSLPRYVLVIFPIFILFSDILEKQKKFVKFGVYFFMIIALIVATVLFSRGYWVS